MWGLYAQNFTNVDHPTKFEKFNNFWRKVVIWSNPKPTNEKNNFIIFLIFFKILWFFPQNADFLEFVFFEMSIFRPESGQSPKNCGWICSNAQTTSPKKFWWHFNKNWRKKSKIWTRSIDPYRGWGESNTQFTVLEKFISPPPPPNSNDLNPCEIFLKNRKLPGKNGVGVLQGQRLPKPDWSRPLRKSPFEFGGNLQKATRVKCQNQFF